MIKNSHRFEAPFGTKHVSITKSDFGKLSEFNFRGNGSISRTEAEVPFYEKLRTLSIERARVCYGRH